MTKETPPTLKAGVAIVSLLSSCAWCSAAMVEFSDTYVGAGEMTTEEQTFAINGYEDPDSNITRPLSVNLMGQNDNYWMPVRKTYAKYMFGKGYVAGAVDYANVNFCLDLCQGSDRDYCAIFAAFGRPGLTNKWRRVRTIKTAVSKMCNRSTVDCSKGLVLSGFSYGAWISNLMVHVEPRITAILGIGIGKYNLNTLLRGQPPQIVAAASAFVGYSCVEDAEMSKHLPKSKRRYIDGVNDRWYIGSGLVSFGLNDYSGYDCGSNYDCIQEDGSGYYITQESDYTQADVEMFNGTFNFAGHYPHVHDPPIVKNTTLMLPSFVNASKKWSMQANFDWLAEAGRVAAPSSVKPACVDCFPAYTDEFVIDRAAGKQGVLGICAVLIALLFAA